MLCEPPQPYFIQSSSGGCCDCGDPLAWKVSGFCRKHKEGYARRNEDGVALLPVPIRRNAQEAILFMVKQMCYHFSELRSLEVSVLSLAPSCSFSVSLYSE